MAGSARWDEASAIRRAGRQGQPLATGVPTTPYCGAHTRCGTYGHIRRFGTRDGHWMNGRCHNWNRIGHIRRLGPDIPRQGGTTTKLNPRHYSDALLHLPAAAAVAVAPPRRIVGPWAPPRRPHPMHVPTLDNRFPDFQSLASGTWLFLPFWSIRHHASSDPLLRSSVQLDLLIYRHSPYHLDRTESYSSSVVY